MNPLTTTHKEIEIVYDEQYDKWRFTLRGKDRSADTLANAKKAINAPAPKEDNFHRFEAWYGSSYGDVFRRVTVTSMTETGRYWISYEEKHPSGRTSKERTQAGLLNIFPCNPENDAVVARLKAKSKEIEALRVELEAIRKELSTAQT